MTIVTRFEDAHLFHRLYLWSTIQYELSQLLVSSFHSQETQAHEIVDRDTGMVDGCRNVKVKSKPRLDVY